MVVKLHAVLGIRDIQVRIRIRTSDYGIRILEIRILSSVTLRMEKYFFLHIIFLVTYPQRYYLQS